MTYEYETAASHCCARHAGDFTLPGAKAHYPPDIQLEPVHLDIALRFDIPAAAAEGVATHIIRARRSGHTHLRLHAVDLDVQSVTDVDGRDVSHRYDGREIHIDWADAFDAGEERRLAVAYRVQGPSTGMYFSSPDDAYPERPFYVATDNETERARHWLPTVDLPTVRPTLEFHLTADAAYEILANGALVEETANDDGTKTAHWKLEQPCPSYLTCISIGDYVRFDDEPYNGIPVAYFTSKDFTPDDLQRSFGRTRDMLAWISEKLDFPFPYPKYFQFGLPYYGGAMENISLVAWDDVFVLDENLAKEWTWLVDQINIHEMAHSYFGDLIVCRDFAHAWLKESWATYIETLWLEHSKGVDERDYDFYTNVMAYAHEADEVYQRPIVTREFNHSWQMYDRHLYPGGAARMHMLRKELGDDTFFAGVREYVKRFAYKVVETADYRRTLEEVSGRSLVKWFDQWIHGKGYPKLKASFSFDKKKGEGTFSIEQTQVDEKQGVGAFDMPLDIGWVVGGKLETRTVQLEKAKHTFVIRSEAEPEQVRIDPHNRSVFTLEFDPGRDKLAKQITDAPDVIGRIRAGSELAKDGSAKNVATVKDAYMREPFWGVRVRFAEALAKAGSQAALDALAEIIGHEQDGLVLEPLLRHVAKHRDEGIAKAIEARLDAGFGMYRATQAAYEALGAQRENAPMQRLIGAATQCDPYGFDQTGAFRGLAASRNEEAAKHLLARIPYGATSNRSRPFALHALGGLGRLQEKRVREQIVEQLVDGLRDPVDRVRDAAVTALKFAGAPEAIAALEAYGKSVSDQDRVAVDRAVGAIRAAQKPSAASQEKALEELRDKLRKLEETVGKLEAKMQ